MRITPCEHAREFVVVSHRGVTDGIFPDATKVASEGTMTSYNVGRKILGLTSG